MARTCTPESGGKNPIHVPASGNTIEVEARDELEITVGTVLQHLWKEKYQ